MKYWIYFVLVALLAAVSGCGGNKSTTFDGVGDISGVIFDQNGGVVANATVYTNIAGGRSTSSNVTGAYLLTKVPGADTPVQAQAFIGTAEYYGTNLTTVHNGEQSKNVNIAVYPVAKLAHIRGTVRDSIGNFLKGVKVFARQDTSGTVLTSSVGISDDFGVFVIDGLVSGITYDIQANGLDYGGYVKQVVLTKGETRNIDVVLPAGSSVTPAAPTGLTAQAWTSPRAIARTANRSNQLSAIKAALGVKTPKKAMASRVSLSGDIEVDLFWTPVIDTSTLGYGIYRATGGGALANVDFFRDPLGELFADQDPSLVPGTDYSYAVTALSTSFSGTSGESAKSNTVTVNPLGDMLIATPTVTAGSVSFTWTAVTGAQDYTVVIFPENPTVGTVAVFTSDPVVGTSYSYSGATLTSGVRYFFALVGRSATGERTASVISTFIR